MKLILFFISSTFISPNNGTICLVSLRHRVREESPEEKRKENLEKPERNPKMKKATTIHLLPELTSDMNCAEYKKHYMANCKLAASIEYTPDSLETLKKIDFTELKMLMSHNNNFFNTAIDLCSNIIDELIRDEKETAAELFEEGEIDKKDYKAIQSVVTLNDLLNCGCYCEDYEDAKEEFIDILLDDYLYKASSHQVNHKSSKVEQIKKTAPCRKNMEIIKLLLNIAMHRDELSADMPLGDFLDWIDKKAKSETLLF